MRRIGWKEMWVLVLRIAFIMLVTIVVKKKKKCFHTVTGSIISTLIYMYTKCVHTYQAYQEGIPYIQTVNVTFDLIV